MRILRFSIIVFAAVLILSALGSAGSAGSFRGTIVENAQTAVHPDWIYVQSRNGMIRRVEIARARVEYDESVPPESRQPKPQQALTAGTEVRVTAEQGRDGEWRAIEVEILKLTNSSGATKTATPGRN